MSHDQEYDLEYVESRNLKMDDTFLFGCKGCGNCCRNRKEPIAITACDFYYIVKAFDMTGDDVMKKITSVDTAQNTHLPTIYLRERQDGSCRLLRKGRCMIQEVKPVVCRLFPLGRYFDLRDNSFHYFSQDFACKGLKQTIRVGDWIEAFHLPEIEEESIYWGRLHLAATKYMLDIFKKDTLKSIDFFFAYLYAFFIDVDATRTCMQNLESGYEKLKKEYRGFDFFEYRG